MEYEHLSDEPAAVREPQAFYKKKKFTAEEYLAIERASMTRHEFSCKCGATMEARHIF